MLTLVLTFVPIAQVLRTISRFLIFVEMIARQWRYINYPDHNVLDKQQT